MTKISAFSIFIIFLSLSVIGFSLLPLVSLEYIPVGHSPSLNIAYNWRGVSPLTLEQQVTATLEGSMNTIEGVKNIYSVSGNGDGYINLEIDPTVDLDMLRFEVAAKIRQLYPKLPEGTSYPLLSLKNPSEEQKERPVLIYSLNGNDRMVNIYRLAYEQIKPRLSLIDGLRDIKVSGGNSMEYRLKINYTILKRTGLKEEDVLKAIKEYYETPLVGIVRGQDRTSYISIKNHNGIGQLEILKIPITSHQGQIILIKDIAEIELEEIPPSSHLRINGDNSIRLSFYAEEGTNTITLANSIKDAIQMVVNELPQSYSLLLETDRTEFLKKELSKIIYRTILSLGILLLFIFLIHRKISYVFIILLGLIASLSLSFIFYYLLNVQLHLYALAGITVSFGIVMDNLIVMMHHYKNTKNTKVFSALLAATLTTVSALVVVWFLPKEWQINLLDFAKVLCINLSVSLVVSLFLIPALIDKIGIKNKNNKGINYKRKKRIIRLNHGYKRIILFLYRFRIFVIFAIILLFGLPTFLIPKEVDNWSHYNKIMTSDWYVENAKPIIDKSLGGTLRLFKNYVYEGSSYNTASETILHIEASMPNGATVEQMNEVFIQLDNYLQTYPEEIKQFTTEIYSGQYAKTNITFNDGYDSSFPFQLKSKAVQFSLNLGGVSWDIYGVGKGFDNDISSSMSNYRLGMYGYHFEGLKGEAERMKEKLETHPRVQSVNTDANLDWWSKDLYEYGMTINSKELAKKNKSILSLKNEIGNYDKKNVSNYYLPDGTSIRFLTNNNKTDIWQLENKSLQIDSSKFKMAYISQLEKKKVSAAIHKENQQYIRLLEWDYTGAYKFGKKHLDACMDEMEKEMPIGYSLEEKKYLGRNQAGETKHYWLLLLVMGLIFFICSILFESFRQAFSILILIPISFIGIFLTFYLFDINFDQGGYTSFVLSSGLVVNSLILIINDYNNFKRKSKGKSNIDIYIKAFNHKIIPILLTVLSTILGLMPFLMSGETEVFWFSLASGTIGGLLFSIFVIVFVNPLLLNLKKSLA